LDSIAWLNARHQNIYLLKLLYGGEFSIITMIIPLIIIYIARHRYQDNYFHDIIF